MKLKVTRQKNVKGPPWSIVITGLPPGDDFTVRSWYLHHWTHKRAIDATDLILGRIDVREYNERGLSVRPVVHPKPKDTLATWDWINRVDKKHKGW